MKKIGIAVLLLGSLIAMPARAALISLEATIDGTQAGTNSQGTGSTNMTLDDIASDFSFSWDISWFGLTGGMLPQSTFTTRYFSIRTRAFKLT